jgi:hypothetical protein
MIFAKEEPRDDHDHHRLRNMAARDWRVIRTFAGRGALGAGRWALEEVGQPYEVRLVSFRAMKEPVLALHPIPTYEEGDLGLFETGAIVFIAARHQGC